MKIIIPVCFLFIFMLQLAAFGQTDSLNISWNANTEPDMKDYILYRSVNSGELSNFEEWSIIPHPNTHYVDMVDITPGNEYFYYLVARDLDNNVSPNSAIASQGLPAIAPGVDLGIDSLPTGVTSRVNMTGYVYDPDDPLDSLFVLPGEEKACTVRWMGDYLEITPVPIDYTGAAGFELTVTDPDSFWDRQYINFIFTDTEIVPEESAQELIVAPNPFRPSRGHEMVYFENLPAAASEIQIYSVSGELLYDKPVNGSQTHRWEWPVVNDRNQKLASGLYIYVIKGEGNKKIKSGKLAVIR
ncbi:MAG: T9SS type A sorting domain-containing protein [Calditrichia bacterium]